MKYSAVILAAAASFVAAQNPTDYFPSCALPGLQTGIAATSCSATDYACQCTSANQAAIQGAAASAIIAACGSDVALNEVLPAAQKFCAAVAAGGSSGSTTSAAGTTSAAATTSAAGTSSTKAATSAAGTSSTKASTIVTSKASTGTAAPSHSGNGTAPTSTSVPVTAGAALAGSVGTLAMAVLGALAAF